MRVLSLVVETIVSAPFGENSYVVNLEAREDCFVVDPGLEPDLIVAALQRRQLSPSAFLVTHGHADHIGGLALLKQRWPECPTVIGRAEAPKLLDPWANLSAQFGMPVTAPPADVFVDEGDVYETAGLALEVAALPGHSSGHVVYIARHVQPPVVFCGDVLMAGSVGRTDFPDGSFAQLAQGIRDKLFTLPDETVVYSGHGPATTIGREKQTNPLVGLFARPWR